MTDRARNTVEPAEPAGRDAAARAALELIQADAPGPSSPKEGKVEGEGVPAGEAAPVSVDVGADAGWLIVGALSLAVWAMSRPGPEALARLARVKRLGMRAGERLGPRFAEALGGWLLGLSVLGEGAEMLAGEALAIRVEATRAQGDSSSSVPVGT